MEIKDSNDWNIVRSRLWGTVYDKVNDTNNIRQLKKMINNIDALATELSRADVEYRRGRSSNRDYLLERINSDVALVEEFILVAALIG
jgi:isoleucyl-tRNA synthetase